MRVYGDIGINLNELEIKDFPYSVDSFLFESKDGQEFNIDFEEGDYGIKDNVIYFRLKSMGITFIDTWRDLKTTEGVNLLENDIEFFKKCKLKSISIYLYADDDIIIDIDKIKFGDREFSFHIGEEVIEYKSNEIEIEIEL